MLRNKLDVLYRLFSNYINFARVEWLFLIYSWDKLSNLLKVKKLVGYEKSFELLFIWYFGLDFIFELYVLWNGDMFYLCWWCNGVNL